ncbi:MAG: homocysteine S-methyltransferase family protein [Flavobacteriaceae bacterium]|nr:homocysteine S-methyltransferase family protein [Flavobacteriaceae bacterium]
MSSIEDCLKNRILVLDGAMGTILQRYKFEEPDFRGELFKDSIIPLKGNYDLLSLTKPEVISKVHEDYLEAGADIIETNTFSANAISMADYQLQDWVYQLNYQSAQLARKAADKYTQLTPEKKRFVAGSIGPTNKTASLSPEVNNPAYRAITFEDLRIAYRDQALALIDGGVDVLLVETVFDTLNAKAALFAIDEINETRSNKIPIMLSGTITDASGRTLSGQTAEAFLVSTAHIPLMSIGFNCALGAHQLTPHLETLAEKTQIPISAHPNAGLPNSFGQYDQTPLEMATQIELYLQKNLVRIIGGCCGTTPEHIRAIAETVEKYQTHLKV